MNLQIIGTKKCRETKKTQRFLQDRGISFHFVDLKERELSEGELNKILAKVKPADLIDTESQLYKKKGFAYMEFDPAEEILENQALMITPVIRNGNEVIVGFNQEVLKNWIQ